MSSDISTNAKIEQFKDFISKLYTVQFCTKTLYEDFLDLCGMPISSSEFEAQFYHNIKMLQEITTFLDKMIKDLEKSHTQ
ncbi:MAG TPA: hypothetical protein VEG44_02650 [Candidatus Acidoferrales bacterium]|nr:hypothetical protein [Candidatus Acidoferrales bacterium]